MLLRAGCIIIGTFCLLQVANALEIAAGEWELSVKQNVSGMPAGIPVQKYRECFSDNDPIPTSFLQARNCHVEEQKILHRTVHYRVNCFTDNGSIVNIGKIRFGDFKIKGSSKTELGDVAGKTMVIRYSFTGRRLGECTLSH